MFHVKSETPNQRIGKIGEDLAASFLVKHGHNIIARNYRKTFGELDVISKRKEIIHFVEVKTVSRVTDGTSDTYRPEDNIHRSKLLRISRTIEAYLSEFDHRGEWQFDVIAIALDHKSKKAHVKYLPDIIL